MATPTSFQVPGFDDSRDKWDSYIVRVEAYFEGNAIANGKTKRALLVSALGQHHLDSRWC